LYGCDHVLFNDGVSREGVHEAAKSHEAEEGNDVEGGDAVAQEEDEEDENTRQKSHAQKGQDVALESHDCEDEGVLEDLGELHVKGHHHEIGVEAHDAVDEDEGKDHEVHDVVGTRGGGVPEVDQVKAQGKEGDAINETHDESLLQIAADGVEVIRDHEHAVTPHQVSEYVGGGGSLPAVGNQQNDRHGGHDPMSPGVEDGGLVH